LSIARKVKLEGYGTVFQTSGNLLDVSGDGRTVVFETAGGLSSRAVSAADGCTSVYEFHSAGAIGQGAVHLISDGQDTQVDGLEECGAEFRYMDGSGANILFTTADPLLSGDVDGVQRDVYDAREEGGFAPGAAGTPECQGAGCQGALSSPPGPTSPGSLNQAPEAPVPPLPPLAATPGTKIGTKTGTKKCAKGKKLTRGKCVKGKATKRKGKGKQ
jgi:hypothetical protein